MHASIGELVHSPYSRIITLQIPALTAAEISGARNARPQDAATTAAARSKGAPLAQRRAKQAGERSL